MTKYEKIKSMSIEEMAKLLMILDARIPTKYACDETACCYCKDGFSCFREWLESDVKRQD